MIKMFEGIFRNRRNVFSWLKFGGETISEGRLRGNDTAAAIVDKISKQVSMMLPTLIKQSEGNYEILNNGLSRLLTNRPCPECSTATFLYKLCSDMLFSGNALAVIVYNRDFTAIERIQPVRASVIEIFESGTDGRLFVRFTWEYDGKTYTVPYSQVIHIPNRISAKRFLGQSPDGELGKTLGIIETLYNAINSIAKNSAMIRGFLKSAINMKREDKRKDANEFNDAFLEAGNSGGVAVIDSRYEFKELNQRGAVMPNDALSNMRKNIYTYFGVSESVVLGTASESEMINFYESIIQPIALQFSMEFTEKVLSSWQRRQGQRIEFKANRLSYASLKTRLEASTQLFDRGIITVNENRALLGYDPVEGGDVRQVSLNYVQANKQNQYQLGEGGEDDEGQSDEDAGSEE